MAERTVVHLVRHGEVHNPDGILYGRLPGYRLSDAGQQMAQTLGRYFADHDVTHLVASPLQRAQETAQPIADALDLQIQTDERLIEAGNSFQGQTFTMRTLRNPFIWPRLINPLKPSWGEPYAEIVARMSAAVESARLAALGHEAVCVSHQLPVWEMRLAAEGKRLWHDPRKRECALASVTSLTFDGASISGVSYAEPCGSRGRTIQGA